MKKLTILLADDDAIQRELFNGILNLHHRESPKGPEVICDFANEGKEALKKINRKKDKKKRTNGKK